MASIIRSRERNVKDQKKEERKRVKDDVIG
jgi:hypothetical protein